MSSGCMFFIGGFTCHVDACYVEGFLGHTGACFCGGVSVSSGCMVLSRGFYVVRVHGFVGGFRGSAPFPGAEQAFLGRAPFDAPRSPIFALGPVLSPVSPCAAIWGGRGSVLRPRGSAGTRESYCGIFPQRFFTRTRHT